LEAEKAAANNLEFSDLDDSDDEAAQDAKEAMAAQAVLEAAEGKFYYYYNIFS
jgi:hypothetical protein